MLKQNFVIFSVKMHSFKSIYNHLRNKLDKHVVFTCFAYIVVCTFERRTRTGGHSLRETILGKWSTAVHIIRTRLPASFSRKNKGRHAQRLREETDVEYDAVFVMTMLFVFLFTFVCF